MIRHIGKLPFSFRFYKTVYKFLNLSIKRRVQIDNVTYNLNLLIEPEFDLYVHKRLRHENGLKSFLDESLKTSDVFFDIGSNLGYYSFRYHAKCKQIVSIDANPILIEKINETIEFNEIKNILTVTAGLSNAREVLVFNIPSAHNLGSFRRALPDSQTIEISTEKLDEICKKLELWPTFIKMDIEGFEYLAFLGATEVLNRVSTVVFEHIETIGGKNDWIEDIFPANKWDLFYIDRVGCLLDYMNIMNYNCSSDIVAIKKS